MYVYILCCIKSSDTYTFKSPFPLQYTNSILAAQSGYSVSAVVALKLTHWSFFFFFFNSFITILAADRNRLQEKVLLLYGLGYYLVC